MPNFLIVWPRAAAEETHKHKHSVRRPRYQGRCASVRLEDASPSCYYIGCLHFILLQWWKSSDQQQHWGKKKNARKKRISDQNPTNKHEAVSVHFASLRLRSSHKVKLPLRPDTRATPKTLADYRSRSSNYCVGHWGLQFLWRFSDPRRFRAKQVEQHRGLKDA